MIIIPRDEYPLVKKQIKEAPTFVFSILEGIISGTVYASSVSFESVLIKSNAGLYYVTGSSTNKAFIHNVIRMFNEATIKNERFTLFSHSENWNRALENELGNRIRKIERYAFTFDPTAYQNRARNLSASYQTEKITKSSIELSKEFDERYYSDYWDSIDNFLQHGFGFILTENNQIISEGVSIFCSTDYAEIDIITDSNYRGKGLAFLVAEQFIEYCLSHHIQPRWECDIDNHGSIRLGNKLGFTTPHTYAIYVKD